LRKEIQMINYKSFFGFTKEPFSQSIKTEEIFQTQAIEAATERISYAINLGAVSVLTGEVGTGKSTTLRFVVSKLHPSQYKIIHVIASTGSVLEILRQISIALDVESRSNSRAMLTKTIRNILIEISKRKQTPVVIIDEAQLLRLDVFLQLHTLGQFEMDSNPLMPLILAGQNSLIDKLMYHSSRPLASRVVGKTFLEGLKLKDMSGYLNHHLSIAGMTKQIFSEEAILAIQQTSSGLLRRANILAAGSLIAAAKEQCPVVSAEHVRIASTEII